MILLKLFWSFFQIGLFSIGGGYAAMPLIQNQVVDLHPWLTMTQFADIMAISEMTPGPIAINTATFVGIQVAGLPGALAATLGCVAPSCLIVMTLAWVYHRFAGLGVVQGVLAGLGQRALPQNPLSADPAALGIFLSGFFILRKWKVNPLCVMAGSAAAGILIYAIL